MYTVDEYGVFHYKIIIVDKDKGLHAEWPIARLQVWLNTVQDKRIENTKDIFKFVDIEWKAIPSTDVSPIPIIENDMDKNQRVVKEATGTYLEDNAISNKSSVVETSEACNKYDDCMEFDLEVLKYLNQISNTAEKLERLCRTRRNTNNSICYVPSPTIKESIEHVRCVINRITNGLEISKI